MANPHPKVDAVIIGVGWVGGIIASELTKAGLKVVGLERGTKRGTSRLPGRPRRARLRDPHTSSSRTRRKETWTLRHNLRETALPIRQLGSFLPGTGLGGAGVHWNGQTWRFHPRDFTIRTSTIDRYGAAMIPAGHDDPGLGHHLRRARAVLRHVRDDGRHRRQGRQPERARSSRAATSSRGRARGSTRSGRQPDSHAGALLRKAAIELGYHPFPRPSANLPVTYTNPDGVARGPCTYCGFCERFGCEVGAKSDPTVTVIPLALKTGKFELRMRSNAFQIKNDGKTAQSVLYYDANGAIQEQPADIVIVASYVFNNARLLLMSKLGKPYDPVSATGAVGKNYAYQTGGGGATRLLQGEEVPPLHGLGRARHGDGRLQRATTSTTAGSASSAAAPSRPARTARGRSRAVACHRARRRSGATGRCAIKQYYDRVMSVGFQGESPSYQTHYVDLDPTYRDNYGNPLLRITFDWETNERKMVAYAGTKLLEIMQAIDADIIVGGPGSLPAHYDVTPYQSTHNTGGVIMGADPNTSAVNSYLQMWDAPNVFVVGACNFPQNAGFNPTGTVGALSYRAAEGILKYHKTGGALV